jgi:hypothetical protein
MDLPLWIAAVVCLILYMLGAITTGYIGFDTVVIVILTLWLLGLVTVPYYGVICVLLILAGVLIVIRLLRRRDK